MSDLPARETALALMHEYTPSESLRRHMYAVEAGMRAYARKSGEDEELWGLTGLLHDFDYERWPNDARSPTEEHPSAGVAVLRALGYPETMLDAVMAHAEYTGVPAKTQMAVTLRAVDELSGFIVACALVRPNRISDMKAKSVRKKMKDRGFAAAVDRDAIVDATDELGEDLSEHIQFVIDAMRAIGGELGLEPES
jgi:putative nucleotidyltransferase with HDIG domain